MAYGVKYRIEFTSKNLVNWRIDLLKNDYAGAIIARNHGADEPNFEFDIEKSIGGVKFDFSIETTTADNTGLTDLFVEDPREFQVIVYRETTPVWFGFLVPEQYSDNYVYPPYDISLSAVDGLGLLKNEEFTLTGVKSEIEILTYILEKTGLSLPIGVCVHIFPQGVATNRAPLQNVFQDCSAFATSSDVPKCYDVLEILLQSYGEKTYITQQNGRWFIFREIDLGNDIHVYTSGNYSATESAPAPIALGRGLTLEPVGNLVRAVEKRFHRIEVTHDLGKKTNMFLPGIINQAAGEFYAGYQRAKYWTRYATSQYPKIVRYGANAELLLLIAGADNNPGAISDPVYYIKNSRPLVFKLDYGIAFTRSVGYTGVQPIYVKIKIGSYFLTKTGWSLTSYTWELPKLAKDNFTNWGVLADPPPASGNLVVEVYNNYLTPGCYIRSFEFNYAEETAFPAKNTYSLNNATSVINTSKFDIIGDIVPDENAHLIYTRYKRLSDGTPTQNWKFPSTANFYSLALCNCRLEASNNRKARQKFTGSLSGVLPGYFFRINHTDAGITTPLYPQKATLNIFSGELTGEFLEWIPFVEQTITVAINEDYKATGSGGSGAGGGGGGSSVVSTPVLWDNVNSKPPFVENINSYFAIGDNNGVAYIRALKDLHVEGNLYQQGTAYETHVEHLFSKNDFIILREDAVSGLPSNQLSGFKILKANGTVNLIFGAGNDAIARVGWEGGSLQAIATRVDTPVDNGIAVWDNANNRFSTPHLVSDFPRKAENAVISGAWNFATRIRINNQNQWFGDGTMFSVGSTNNVGIRNDLGGIYFGNNTPAMSILLNKNIGVGTTSPEVLFHVAGNARVNSQLQVGQWNTYIYGGGHAGLYASGEQYFRAEGTNNLFRIYKNTIAEGNLSSNSFISGFAGNGWSLDATDNHLTVDNLTVRKQLKVYELLVEQLRAQRGSIVVSPGAAKIESATTSRAFVDTDNGRLPISIVVGDKVRCQRFTGNGTKYIVANVTAIGSNYFDYTVIDGTGPLAAGDEVAVFGSDVSTRQGIIYITSSDDGAPYMDVLDGVNSASLSGKTRIRIGKLSGISEQSGYGIWGSRDGVNEAFVISSNGYARIAGWSFTNNQLVSPTVDGGFIQMLVDGYPRIQVYRNEDNRVNIYHYSSSDWGIAGRKDGAWVFRLGGINQIAGCNFNAGAIWSTGEKWRLNADGSGHLAGNKIFWDAAGNLTIQQSLIAQSLIGQTLKSTNWTGDGSTEGVLFDLDSGILKFANILSLDANSKELTVWDAANQRIGVRLGDFALSNLFSAFTSISGSITGSFAAQASNYNLSDVIYVNTSRALTRTVSNVNGTVFTIGGGYSVSTGFNLAFSRGSLVATAMGPSAKPLNMQWVDGEILVSITLLDGNNNQIYKLTNSVRGEQYLTHSFSQSINIIRQFAANNSYLRIKLDLTGSMTAYESFSWDGDPNSGLVGIRSYRINCTTTGTTINLVATSSITELSTKGFLSLWGSGKYFQIQETGVSTDPLVTSKGFTRLESQNGNHKLEVKDNGVYMTAGTSQLIQFRYGTWTSDLDTAVTVTFSTPFPTACLVVVTDEWQGTNQLNKTASGFTIDRHDSVDGTLTRHYIAIGY